VDVYVEVLHRDYPDRNQSCQKEVASNFGGKLSELRMIRGIF
jgi:hypothetical protein